MDFGLLSGQIPLFSVSSLIGIKKAYCFTGMRGVLVRAALKLTDLRLRIKILSSG